MKSHSARRSCRALSPAVVAVVAAALVGAPTTSSAAAVTAHFLTNTPAQFGVWSWSYAPNWSSNPNAPYNGTPAGTTYDAVIDFIPGQFQVNLAVSDAVTVDSVTVNSSAANLSVSSGGTLVAINGLNLLAGQFQLDAGTVRNTTINGGAFNVFNTNSALDNVTLANTTATVLATPNQARTLTVRNGLTLNNGVVLLDGYFDNYPAHLKFAGTTPSLLGGTGEVVFNGSIDNFHPIDWIDLDTGGLTIGAGVIVRTGTACATINAQKKSLTNQGTISAQTAGHFVDLYNVVNTGTLEVKNGSFLNLFNTWTNNGVIVVNNGTLNFGGTDSINAIGTVQRTGGTVNYTGTLNNAGKNFDCSTTPAGAIDFGGSATVNGGTIIASNSAVTPVVRRILQGQSDLFNYDNTYFDGVALNTNLNVTGGSLIVKTGLTLLNNRTVSVAAINNDPAVDIFNNGRSEIMFWNNAPLGGTGVISFDGAGSGNLIATSGGDLTIASGITIRTGTQGGVIGWFNGLYTVVNQGTIVAQTAGKTILLRGPNFTNAGTLEARNGGTIQLPSQFNLTNLAGSTLTGGRYFVGAGSTIDFDSRTFNTNAANVILEGAGSTFAAVAPINNNTGTFEIDKGRDFTTVGALANAGTLRVGKGSTLTVNGPLTNTGKIKGNGTIVTGAAGLTSSGSIEPGESPGQLSITGNLALTASSILEIEIGGTTPGVGYDVLDVSGNLALDGTLHVTFVNGFSPSSSDVFDFLDFSSATGSFDTVQLPPLPPGVGWDAAAIANGGAAGVPEPAGAVMTTISLGVTALMKRRRQRRRGVH